MRSEEVCVPESPVVFTQSSFRRLFAESVSASNAFKERDAAKINSPAKVCRKAGQTGVFQIWTRVNMGK